MFSDVVSVNRCAQEAVEWLVVKLLIAEEIVACTSILVKTNTGYSKLMSYNTDFIVAELY